MAVQWRQRHRLADAESGSGDGERGARHHWRRAVAVGLAVMLARPHRVVAQPARLGCELEAFAVRPVPWLAQPAVGLEAEGDAELEHGLSSRAQRGILTAATKIPR